MKNIYFIILSVLCMIYVIHIVRKKKLSIGESFWWFFASIIMLLLSIFPYTINWLAKIFNIAYPPSLLFVFCIVFLVFINFRATKKLSELQSKVTELAQQVSILKSNQEDKNHE